MSQRERVDEARQIAEKFKNSPIRKYGFTLLANGSSLRRTPKCKRSNTARFVIEPPYAVQVETAK
jgi:uncharacterized protein YlaI